MYRPVFNLKEHPSQCRSPSWRKNEKIPKFSRIQSKERHISTPLQVRRRPKAYNSKYLPVVSQQKKYCKKM